MDNELLNGPTAVTLVEGLGSAGMSLSDAATKGVVQTAERTDYTHQGKSYPMFHLGLSAFSADGLDSKLASAITAMRRRAIYRAWCGGKVQLSNKEISAKTVEDVSAAPRSGPLLVLKGWEEWLAADPTGRAAMEKELRGSPADPSSFGSDSYHFEVADPGLKLPYLVALRPPTVKEMAGTPSTWYADRESAREVHMDPNGPREAVTVYTKAGCTGNSRHFFEGRYDMADLKERGIGNDSIASLSVGRKYSVTVYAASGFSGPSKTFDGGTTALSSARHDLPSNLLKDVSSMEVMSGRPVPGSTGHNQGYIQLDNGRFL